MPASISIDNNVLDFETMNKAELMTKITSQLLHGEYKYFSLWCGMAQTDDFTEEERAEIKKAIQSSLTKAEKIKRLFEKNSKEIDKTTAENAIVFLGLLYQAGGVCGKRDYNKAIKLFDKAIKHGNAAAMNSRALMHDKGQGGKRNYSKAIKLYKKAIKLENAAAMNNRAYMHQHGQGGDINDNEAIKLFDKAIKLGSASAMNNRAVMHCDGHDGEPDYEAAKKLFDKAIKLGNTTAMHNRGAMHRNGQGGAIDYQAAIKLFDKAIELGNTGAMNSRAIMHCDGQGGKIDYPEAIKLFDKAIELGNTSAMNIRATMHQNGEGGKIDYPEAIKLYEKAIALGNADAVKYRTDMDKRGKGSNPNDAHVLLELIWEDLLDNKPFTPYTVRLLSGYCREAVLDKLIDKPIDKLIDKPIARDLKKLALISKKDHVIAKILGAGPLGGSTEYQDLVKHKNQVAMEAQALSQWLVEKRWMYKDVAVEMLSFSVNKDAAQDICTESFLLEKAAATMNPIMWFAFQHPVASAAIIAGIAVAIAVLSMVIVGVMALLGVGAVVGIAGGTGLVSGTGTFFASKTINPLGKDSSEEQKPKISVKTGRD